MYNDASRVVSCCRWTSGRMGGNVNSNIMNAQGNRIKIGIPWVYDDNSRHKCSRLQGIDMIKGYNECEDDMFLCRYENENLC